MDKQQEIFEAWYSDNYSAYALKSWDVDGECYSNLDTELAWQAWQAAIAAVKQQAPLSMRDPLRQSSVLVQEWNEGVADHDEWGNEACQVILELYSCIATLLIEAAEKQAAIAAQWQPIETAPKDETPVLAYRKSRHGVDISSMYYVDGDWYWYYDGEMPADPPTHWMPLPPEPAK